MEALFGSKTAQQILFFLEEHDELCASDLAQQSKVPINMLQKQLEKFEREQLLQSKWEGKKKIYFWNKKFVGLVELKKLLRILRKKSLEKKQAQQNENPADGSHLPIADRLKDAEQLYQQASQLNPFLYFQPFVKSFTTREEYENWQKKQKNPWLIG